MDYLTRVEDSKVAQDLPGQKRICYGSDSGDLFLWVNGKNQTLSSFQLTFFDYGDDRKEYIVLWEGGRLKTGLVDSKEVDGRCHDLQTPTVQFYVNKKKEIVRKGELFLEKYGTGVPSGLKFLVLGIMKGESIPEEKRVVIASEPGQASVKKI